MTVPAQLVPSYTLRVLAGKHGPIRSAAERVRAQLATHLASRQLGARPC